MLQTIILRNYWLDFLHQGCNRQIFVSKKGFRIESPQLFRKSDKTFGTPKCIGNCYFVDNQSHFLLKL